MKGVVFLGDRKLELQQFDDPAPGPDEVVIEMKASGLCGSDLKFYRSPQGQGLRDLGYEEAGPVIAGHEPCGEVVAVGANVHPLQARVGQRVMVHHYKGCGYCPHCSTGWMQLCIDGVEKVYGVNGHGGHARYMKTPAATVVNLPDELSYVTGAAISCGTGTAWGAIKRLDIGADHTLAIFGQGPVGLSATQVAAAMGIRVIALDINPERLARARDFGAAELVDPSQTDAVAAIRELTRGLGAHATLEASSSAAARSQAVQSVCTWGKACLVGEGGAMSLNVSPDILRRQVTIIGSWTFSTHGQEECARFIADKRVDVERLFTHQWKLSEAEEAYRVFDRQADGKGVFVDFS